MALDITFTGHNPFTNDQIKAGIAAAQAVFDVHGIDAGAAYQRNVRSIENDGEEDALWTEADHAASVAMCGSADVTAAENATLEWN